MISTQMLKLSVFLQRRFKVKDQVKKINSSWPQYSKNEIEEVKDILISGKVNYWTGNKCRNFEEEFAKWTGTKYAVATMNGTVALELCLRALNIGTGDDVIVTSRSFIASVSTIVNVGANPVFCDVEIDSGNISASKIGSVITPSTRAIICVHLAGWPCDMDPIRKLVKHKGIFLIEDCAQAHGAVYKGKKVGSLGDIAAWSFCQDKIISTGGEGGMVTCNSDTLFKRVWSYKDHGKNLDSIVDNKPQTGFKWVHDSIGSNFRMTEIQASLGLSQLKKMREWTNARNNNALFLRNALSKFSTNNGCITIPEMNCETCKKQINCLCVHAYYKFYIYINPQGLKEGWTRNRVIEEINDSGITCSSGSCSEMYLEKAIKKDNRPTKRFSNARQLGDSSISLLVHPNLTIDELNYMKDKLQNIFQRASKY